MRITALFTPCFAAAACALALCAPAAAQWSLDNEASDLRFISTKAGQVAEVHQFKRLGGGLSASGQVRLVVDLASAETGVPIRNERLQAMLFEVLQFPQAVFEAQLDAPQQAAVAALAPGAVLDLALPGRLTLHGRTQALQAALRVVGLQGGRLLVSTRAPLVLQASAFDLLAGVEKLREAVGLSAISPAVPVSFTLALQR